MFYLQESILGTLFIPNFSLGFYEGFLVLFLFCFFLFFLFFTSTLISKSKRNWKYVLTLSIFKTSTIMEFNQLNPRLQDDFFFFFWKRSHISRTFFRNCKLRPFLEGHSGAVSGNKQKIPRMADIRKKNQTIETHAYCGKDCYVKLQ